MATNTLHLNGQFKIDDLGTILDANANSDYSITFSNANIVDHDNEIMVKISIDYDYDTDTFTIVWVDNYGVEYNSDTRVDFLDRFFDGVDTKMTGVAMITMSCDETDNYIFENIELLSTNVIFLFRLNSERDTVNKSLIDKGSITGYFRSGVNVKNPVISVQSFYINNTFNYVYLCALNRYYYVQNVEMTTKDMSALLLAEDVLMSHKDIILQQSAYIERQESDYNLNLVDDMLITDYNKNISYTSISFTNNIFKNINTNVDSTGSYIVLTVNDETI